MPITLRGAPRRLMMPALLLAAALAPPPALAQSAPVHASSSLARLLPFADEDPAAPFTKPVGFYIWVGGKGFSVTMDTGSTGLALTADSIPGYSLEMAARYPIGWEYLSSSGFLWVGHLIPMDVVFRDSSGGTVTATVPVLAVEREAICPGDTYKGGPACPGIELRPAAPRIRYMGVGFGRENDGQPYATPDRNPFLNITRIGDAPVPPGRMRSGYIVTAAGVHVGLTPENTRGFALAPLTLRPGFQDPRDWAEATMCVSVNDSPCASGTLLTDTGIDYMFLTLPPGTAVDTAAGGRLRDSSRVTVRVPATGDIAGSYTFTVGEAGNPAAPCHVSLTRPKPAAFVNTGEHFFRAFDVLFDADGGWFGLRAAGRAGTSGGGAGRSAGAPDCLTRPIPTGPGPVRPRT